MTKPAKTSTGPAETGPGVVLFGLDSSGKPRAARFGGHHAELAGKAAGHMGLNICALTTPELVEIAEKLPKGKMYANGRGFVPNIRRDLYAKLIESAGVSSETGQRTSSSEQPGSSQAPSLVSLAQGYPRDWDDIQVGHLVLAQEKVDEGWWEAIVIGIEGDMLTMRWRDWPKYPKVTQHRSAVALLKPGTP
jgi:hypothetical protein